MTHWLVTYWLFIGTGNLFLVRTVKICRKHKSPNVLRRKHRRSCDVLLASILCLDSINKTFIKIKMGPFKCYATQMGVGGCQNFRKKRYEGVRFNVISVTRGWVGVQFPEKKRYVTLEWPPMF